MKENVHEIIKEKRLKRNRQPFTAYKIRGLSMQSSFILTPVAGIGWRLRDYYNSTPKAYRLNGCACGAIEKAAQV